MTITHDTMTVETVIHAVRQLAPSILDRAAEIETGRRVPPDLVDELRAAGCFRLVRPATHGGLEASIPDAMRALESLARADASVAWTVTTKVSLPSTVPRPPLTVPSTTGTASTGYPSGSPSSRFTSKSPPVASRMPCSTESLTVDSMTLHPASVGARTRAASRAREAGRRMRSA